MLQLDEGELRTLRWRRISMVFQSAMDALNPVITIGEQIIDTLVVHGADGLDEISLSAETTVCEVDGSEIVTYTLRPEALGLTRADPSALKGGSLEDNVRILREVLGGAPGAPRDAVLLNAAAVLLVAGVAADIKQGIALAADAVDAGRAQEKLEHFVRLSQGLASGAA